MKNAITFNFNEKADKGITQNLLNELKNETGEDNPVILNKALRLYKLFHGAGLI